MRLTTFGKLFFSFAFAILVGFGFLFFWLFKVNSDHFSKNILQRNPQLALFNTVFDDLNNTSIEGSFTNIIDSLQRRKLITVFLKNKLQYDSWKKLRENDVVSLSSSYRIISLKNTKMGDIPACVLLVDEDIGFNRETGTSLSLQLSGLTSDSGTKRALLKVKWLELKVNGKWKVQAFQVV